MDISTHQMSKLRLGMMDQITRKRGVDWAHIEMGRSAREILDQANDKSLDIDALVADSMWMAQIQAAYKVETTLRRLSDVEFERLIRHGFETANYTLLINPRLPSNSISFDPQWLEDMKPDVAVGEQGDDSAESPSSQALSSNS